MDLHAKCQSGVPHRDLICPRPISCFLVAIPLRLLSFLILHFNFSLVGSISRSETGCFRLCDSGLYVARRQGMPRVWGSTTPNPHPTPESQLEWPPVYGGVISTPSTDGRYTCDQTSSVGPTPEVCILTPPLICLSPFFMNPSHPSLPDVLLSPPPPPFLPSREQDFQRQVWLTPTDYPECLILSSDRETGNALRVTYSPSHPTQLSFWHTTHTTSAPPPPQQGAVILCRCNIPDSSNLEVIWPTAWNGFMFGSLQMKVELDVYIFIY